MIEEGISVSIEKHKVSGHRFLTRDKRKPAQTEGGQFFKKTFEKQEESGVNSEKPGKKKIESHSGTNLRSFHNKPKDAKTSRYTQKDPNKRVFGKKRKPIER